jgi:antitoxin (DNA-binding transcriptional repressor) of toxin-antitoxin stability system
MKTMTVRDIRQRWPEAERALAVEKEIIITRDGQPVAKLTRIVPEKKKRKRFDPAEQKRFRESVFGKGVVVDWVREFCEVDRAERF